MRFYPRYLLVVIFLLSVTVAGFALRSDSYFQIKKNFTLFSEVIENISSAYIDDVDPEPLIRRGIDAMLEELDPYTVMIDETESRRMDAVTTGQYAGVGLEVGSRGGRLVVIAPIEGYSADRRGIRAGDVILEVDGIDVTAMSVDDLQSLLRGDPGSIVTLTIERYGIDESLDFELTRETVEVKNVGYSALLDSDSRIGYVMLRRFAQNAAEEVREAILELQEEGPLDGLVLDVRNNPGGLLNEAVRMIDIFVPAGEKVVWTEGRLSRASQEYETSEEPIYPDQPLVILQNNGSASASEIVSGALQDLDRAVIMGERSFGKGLVQIVQSLSYNNSLKMTTSQYYIPSGRSIQSTPYLTEEEAAAMEEVPDSLKERFETKGGRTVYEGIGIEPDLTVEQRQQSMLEIALLQNSHYFFFANEYIAEIDTLEAKVDTEKLFETFQQYLSDQDFEYTTRAERHLENFRKSLNSSLKEQSEERIASMQELIDIEKQQEMKENTEYIKRELYLELVSRFEGSTGRMREQLKSDPPALKAIETIEQGDRYFSILEL